MFGSASVDAMGARFFEALGASPVQLPWGEVVPSLATGAIDGVTTSSSSGVDGSFWEFLDYMNRFNWQGSAIMVNVNLDAWNALSPEQSGSDRESRERDGGGISGTSRGQRTRRSWPFSPITGSPSPHPTTNLAAALLEISKPMWDEFMNRCSGIARHHRGVSRRALTPATRQ